MSMKLLRLILAETGTYNDIALRPYQTSMSPETMSVIQEATNNGRNYDATTLAGVAGQVIRPVTQAQGLVSIAQGWDAPRFRFLMVIEHQAFAGASVIQYLTGYTDHVGISHGNHLDPNMRMFINNSITTRNIMHNTPLGRVNQQTITDASHVLQGSFSPSFDNINQAVHSMRPEDLFKSIGATSVMGDVTDLRSTFAGEGMKKSRRSNGAPTTYLSRVMQAHSAAQANTDPDDSPQSVMMKSAGMVKEGLVAQDYFISQARRQTSLQEGSSLSFAELNMMFPNAEHDAVVALQRGVAANTAHVRGSTEFWGGTTNETIFATILSHSVPGIMMDLMLQKVAFMATNQTLDGSFFVQLAGAGSFAENVDLSPYLQLFEQRLKTEILQDLTQNNQIPIQVSCTYDLLGETTIDVSVAGGPIIRYTTPSFCDALFAPVLTNDARSLKIMAHDIDQMFDNMNVDYSVANTGYPLSTQELYGNGTSDTV